MNIKKLFKTIFPYRILTLLLSAKRLLQVLTVCSTLWFLYWIAYDMIVWSKPFPSNMTNVFGFILSIVFLLFFSYSHSFEKHISNVNLTKTLKPQVTEEIPKEWLKETAKPSTSHEITTRYKQTKIKIPMLKTIKRVIAGFLILAYLAITQTMLLSGEAQSFAVIFILTLFILLDYLWKTRGGRS